MLAVGAGPVADVIARHAIVLDIDEMEAALRGMKAEIGDPHDVATPWDVTARKGARDLVASEREQSAIAFARPADLGREGSGRGEGRAGGDGGPDEGATIKCSGHARVLAVSAWPGHERSGCGATDADETPGKRVQSPRTMRSPSIRIAPISVRKLWPRRETGRPCGTITASRSRIS